MLLELKTDSGLLVLLGGYGGDGNFKGRGPEAGSRSRGVHLEGYIGRLALLFLFTPCLHGMGGFLHYVCLANEV